ncbi:hypothetical protein IGB31_00150 [Pseudomonas putida]|nr:hypothetical protein IGB31_00150 [Pseudomonas putida]
MKATRIQKLALLITLSMTAALVHAEEKVTVINPECLERIEATHQALDAAHAKGEFMKVTVNKDMPAFLDGEVCNVNLEMEVKSLADAKKLQAEFRKYLLLNSKITTSHPSITKIK